MKKILYTLIIVAAVLSSCTITDQIENNHNDNPPVFTAIIDEVPATRTFLDSTYQQLWSENDCISVYSSVSFLISVTIDLIVLPKCSISGVPPI